MTSKLTVKMVERAVYEGEPITNDKGETRWPRCVLWDAEIKGFGLRVLPSGRKTWVVSYRASGIKRLKKIGTYPVTNLPDARKAARKELGLVEGGRDPLEELRKERQGETVRDLVKAFLKDHVDAKLRPATRREYRRQLEQEVLPRLGSRKVANVRRSDIARLHAKIGERAPYVANRLVSTLAKAFEFGRRRGFMEDNAPNPARGIDRFKELKRDRWVQPVELPRLAAAIDEEPSLYARAAMWLYLLTGVRKSELLRARWEHVDLDRKELAVPETKAGRAHYVPLSQEALAILDKLPKLDGNPYVLPGMREGEHLMNIDQPWRRARERATMSQWKEDPRVFKVLERLEAENAAKPKRRQRQGPPSCSEVQAAAEFELPRGLLDVRLHDLRRTVGSWLASFGGASLPVIGRVLNHSQPQTTAVYARLSEDPARQALEDHGKRLMEVARPNGNGGPGLRVVK